MRANSVFRVFVGLLCALAFIPTQSQNSSATEYDYPYREYLFDNTNALRAELGLPPFTYDESLEEAAFVQADWMVRNWSYAHVHGGSTPATRAEAAGYVDVEWCCSENTFLSPTRTPEGALNFWIRSRAHYDQLTSTEFDQMGVGFDHGRERTGQVIVFGKRGDSPDTATVDDTAETPAATSVPEPTAVAMTQAQHQVARGENLYRIGLRYGFSADEIRAANGIVGSTIYVGQILIIPGQTTVSASAPTTNAAVGPTVEDVRSVPVSTVTETVRSHACTGVDGASNQLVQLNRADLTCRVMVENGFYHVSHAQIGHQEVIDAGVIHAVDIFGYDGSVEVCMRGRGIALFLSERDAPRVPIPLATTVQDAFTCAQLNSGGILSLVNATVEEFGTGGTGERYIPENPVEFVELSSTDWGNDLGETYTVRLGDTLFSIARLYDTSPDQLMEANSLGGFTIYPGQQLRIP